MSWKLGSSIGERKEVSTRPREVHLPAPDVRPITLQSKEELHWVVEESFSEAPQGFNVAHHSVSMTVCYLLPWARRNLPQEHRPGVSLDILLFGTVY